ncbi:MAG: PKD domain-containing protein [Patescibacteria group bacterium]
MSLLTKSLTKFKKVLLIGLLTVSFGLISTPALTDTAQAFDWDSEGDWGQFFGDMFQTGEQGLSFTQYQGTLTELSTDGFDDALVASTDAKDFVKRIVNYALGFLGFIAVIMIIYAGVLYVTAGGEDDGVGKAKKIIMYSAIGLLIVMGSFAFVNTIIKSGTDGEELLTGTARTALTSSSSFNASAEQVKSIALEIFNGFAFLAESTEEFKNIKNDIDKESLLPQNLPSRTEMLTFLYSIQSKLSNIKSKLPPFSESEGLINEFLRDIDKDLDIIESLGTKRYLKFINDQQTEIFYCDVQAERSGWEGLISASDESICNTAGYNYYYIEGLFEAWLKLHKKYSEVIPASASVDKQKESIYYLIEVLSNDYRDQLAEKFRILESIFAQFLNIDAINKGNAATAFNDMKSGLGYGYEFNADTNAITNQSSGLYNHIINWSVETDIGKAGDTLLYGLKQQSILYEELKQLKFVNAKLTANTVTGAAPLVVTFDVLGSADPAGGTIQGENITWDLGGTKTTEEFLNSPSGATLVPEDGSVNCSTFINPDDEEDFVGQNSKRCIFTRPGTYTAAVRINSNDPTKYAPGITVLTIKVTPPKTKIELTVDSSSESQPQVVIDYDETTGLLLTDRQTVSVTLNDAKAGLTFDASNTPDVSQFKWDLGNGEIIEYSSSGLLDGESSPKYTEAGKYEVVLEVVNLLGEKDKKIFTLEVASVVARIRANTPNNAFINNLLTFDGSTSKSDLGKISSYEWTIKASAGQIIPASIKDDFDKIYPFTDSGNSLKSITHEFKYPLKYDISLKVTATGPSGQNTDEFTITGYRVASKPPVAAFDFTIPDKTQPGTVHFDGSRSFDPDGTFDFKYEWEIKPDVGNISKIKNPIVKFKEKGAYTVKLKVIDVLNPDSEFSEISKNIKIDKVLDIAWADGQASTGVLDDDGLAELEFELESDAADDTDVTFEIDFGDGENASGEFGDDIAHAYKKAGKYLVRATIYDEDDVENSIEKRVFISGGELPLAKISIEVNGEEIADPSELIVVNKKDVLTFSAKDSRNTDGTFKDLKFSWNFGDEKLSSKSRINHAYKEVNPVGDEYEVTLQVSDKDDPELVSEEDTIQIQVVNVPPKFSTVQGIPQKSTSKLITPVTINTKVFGSEDIDGQIVKYKWWYFDINNPDEPLGTQITSNTSAQLIIGTKGKQAAEMTYGFGLEVTDNDGLSYSNEEDIEDGNYSKVTVINGPNKLPIAGLSVNTTLVYAGDTVTFTSTSTDSDGEIKSYIFDFEGDGFYNNDPTKEASVEHTYEKINQEGYEVRLKVVDDKGAESISTPVKIYVKGLTKPPKADFEFEAIKGSGGMKVKFINKSTADDMTGAKILTYHWDFDTESDLETADSDLDSIKDNDINSTQRDPQRLYKYPGEYVVKLEIVDNVGNTDKVSKTLQIPLEIDEEITAAKDLTEAPNVNGLKASLIVNPQPASDNIVYLNGEKDTVQFDFSKSIGSISYYIIDKNIYFDTDLDGNKTNDEDFKTPLPGTWTTNFEKIWGKTVVKLTVRDIYGNEDAITQEIQFSNP